MITSSGLTLSRWPYHLTLVGLSYMWKILGAFHSIKIPVWNFGNSTCPMEQSLPVAKTRPKAPRVWLQNTKQRYWGQQFCQMERDISVQPTKVTRLLKEVHLQSWFQIFQLDQIKMVLSIKKYLLKFMEFWVEWKAPLTTSFFCWLIYFFPFLKSCFNVTSRKVNIKLW